MTKMEMRTEHDSISAIAEAVPVAANARAKAMRAHPLLASALAAGESRFDFEAFAAAFVGDLTPVGPVEATLAARAAGLAWRLNRAQSVESAFLSKPESCGSQETPLENALDSRHDVSVLEGINRWETSLQRSLLKILTELEHRQTQRRMSAEIPSICADAIFSEPESGPNTL